MPFALFDTPLGPCGIAWSERGITCVQLPDANERATRERLAARAAEDATEAMPPAWVRDATCRIARVLEGARDDLRSVRLDTRGVPPFHARVYELSREVRPGETMTYGQLAARAGSPGGSRAVGQAMAKNPYPIVVPCHRVLAANGRPGGFSAFGGADTKRKMLAIEGVTLEDDAGSLPLPFASKRSSA